MSDLTDMVIGVVGVFKEPLAYGFAVMIAFAVLTRLIGLSRSTT